MAIVRKITEMPVTTKIHPTETECEVRAVETRNGSSLIQLTTFGSVDRASGRKPSQTIQLTTDAARQLVQIIERSSPVPDADS